MDQISIECVSNIDRELLLEEALRYAQSRARQCAEEIEAYEARLSELGAVLVEYVREGEAEVAATRARMERLEQARQDTFEHDALDAIHSAMASERVRLAFAEVELARRVRLLHEAEWRVCPAIAQSVDRKGTLGASAALLCESPDAVRAQLVEHTLFGLLAAKIEAERRACGVEVAYSTSRQELARCKGQLQDARDRCEKLEADLRHANVRLGRRRECDRDRSASPRSLSPWRVRDANALLPSVYSYKAAGCSLCAASADPALAEVSFVPSDAPLFALEPASLSCADGYPLLDVAPRPPPKLLRRRPPDALSSTISQLSRAHAGHTPLPSRRALRSSRRAGGHGSLLRRVVALLRGLRRVWLWLLRALAAMLAPSSIVRL